ncbi:Chromosome transmission fidelity protein 18 [Apiospora phragmitis]|uniref:Chromosome transmission fidelity protein 18 n=1 Tax=Apiospora phragmitis TaxID=2905665 RepID=A0ABR1T7D7_9PEZI
MLTASSPVVYPTTSSPPPASKRAQPHKGPKPSKRGKGGFLVDDDSDDDVAPEPASKRRMLSSPRELPVESTEPSYPPTELEAFLNVPLRLECDNTKPTTDANPSAEPPQATNHIYDSLLQPTQDFASAFQNLASRNTKGKFTIKTCSGASQEIKQRQAVTTPSYERLVAARPANALGRGSSGEKPRKSLLWTEKYRARNFMDLCGDDGTNRNVLRWLKRWDPLVFPGSSRSRGIRRPGAKQQVEEEKPHRKILMLTGPPGLGKTTLAHVCARQAGYEVLEINASDDRSRDVVKNQIRTSLGTENVKIVQHKAGQSGQCQKIARPVCVVVDEVDGVVSGSSGSGEGGFVKALLDLIAIGEKNSSGQSENHTQTHRRKKKGDDFRQMRPLILICNDVYHPSLRPLRQSNLAEVIHVGKPTVDAVVNRLKAVFEKEGIPCEKDAARKLCESAWGMSSGLDAKKGRESTAEGDLRGIMVVGEWVAGRLRAASLKGPLCLTRQWVEKHIAHELAHGGGGARGSGRGSVRDIVSRIFQEGAGFPSSNMIVPKMNLNSSEQPQAQLGFSEQQKKHAMERLQHMVETSGDIDRIVTDIFADYPNHDFNDDSFLTKPDQAYEWMYFHDTCTSSSCLSPLVRVAYPPFPADVPKTRRDRGGSGTPPFTGPRADFVAYETEKSNRAMLQTIQAQLSPTLMRAFRSAEDISTDFMPYLIRLVSPDVKPVVVGGSGDQKGTASVRKELEKAMVTRGAETLLDIGVELQRGKIEGDTFGRGPTWVYRMDPDLDVLATYETSAAAVHGTQAPTRYAVRQVLDQEMEKLRRLRESAARQTRFRTGNPLDQREAVLDTKEKSGKPKGVELPVIPVKKDFFGRVVVKTDVQPLQEGDGNANGKKAKSNEEPAGENKVWVTFHEGLNNAQNILEDLDTQDECQFGKSPLRFGSFEVTSQVSDISTSVGFLHHTALLRPGEPEAAAARPCPGLPAEAAQAAHGPVSPRADGSDAGGRRRGGPDGAAPARARDPAHPRRDGQERRRAGRQDLRDDGGRERERRGALWDREQNHEGDGDGSSRPRPGGGFPRIEDADRQARSMREMEEEAKLFRDVLGSLGREEP